MRGNFRTIMPDLSPELRIQHKSGICLIGSCFTEHIGQKLKEAKFNSLQNPFGILYNPFSIANSLERIIANQPFAPEDLVERNGLWVSFEHHSRYADLDATLALKKMNNSLMEAHQFLKEAKVLFISLGTAKVYQSKKTERIVANCHKFPASNFNHFLTKKEDVVAILAQAIKKLQDFNPNLQIIFTVSPVRHLKDGFVENQQSKSTLLLAISQLEKTNPNVHYFPSYEIMLDDLRDYRFYERDMVHPNQLAIDYIFDFFSRAYFDENTQKLMKAIAKLKDAVNHRPFNPKSEAYQSFVKKTLLNIETLLFQHPYLDFDEEQKLLQNRQIVID